ncbi:MAG: hypothetical protein N2517_07590 [Ignavibacteria bacterium]|nr:hypothetical protein [Ignavibacteria bacterium]
MQKNRLKFLTFWLLFFISNSIIFSQIYLANPATWLFPNGNPQGTFRQQVPSAEQDIGKFLIKWRTNSISGQAQTLVGNIINDPKIDESLPFAPNEIVAVTGGKIIVVDGRGQTRKSNSYPIPFLKNVSILFDTLSPIYYPTPSSVVSLGLETVEFENQKDTLAYTYLASYDETADTISLIKRVVVDMREYKPNTFASMKIFLGRRFAGNFLTYASVNIINPNISTSDPSKPPFFRGFSVFPSNRLVNTFPLPEITDDQNFRVTLGPEVSFTQPSINIVGGNLQILIPNYASLKQNVNVPNYISLNRTNPLKSYLLSYSLINNQIRQTFPPLELNSILDTRGKRAQIRPFFVTLNNSSTRDSLYILVAEEYKGIDSSYGSPRLHLFDYQGNAITFPNDYYSPSFSVGSENHQWSIAVGNVDGIQTNSFLPYFPNNPGNEIIVTMSSIYRTVPNNRLFILRYNAGNPVPKPSPPNYFLFPFDTICSFRINGWIACVNDLDGAENKKEELILADGSRLLILQMRDYNSFEFKMGIPFDTLWFYEFRNETIHRVLVCDLEGDAKNDLIVTTNNFTYLIGNPLPKMIEVNEPKYSEGTPFIFCIGDTLLIKIESKAKTERQINLRFVPISQGNYEYAKSFLIAKNITLHQKHTTVKIFINANYENKEGIIYLENSTDTTEIFDSTAVLRFTKPSLFWHTSNRHNFFDDVSISFSTSCVDTARIEYSIDNKTWNILGSVSNSGLTNTFNFSLPCLPIFDCSSKDVKGYVSIRAVIFKGFFKDTTDIFPIDVYPKKFLVTYDSSKSICCHKIFRWVDLPFDCDTLNVLLFENKDQKFYQLKKIPTSTGEFKFEQKRTHPEQLILRFCCANGCYSADTLLYITKPKYINSIAPNPFNPTVESTEISYILEKDANVTMRILDQGNRIVYEILNSSFRFGNTYYCERWDGKKLDGSIVAPGLYYVFLLLSDGNQEIFPIFVK